MERMETIEREERLNRASRRLYRARRAEEDAGVVRTRSEADLRRPRAVPSGPVVPRASLRVEGRHNPNAYLPFHTKQLKHQMVQGDGRPRMLSRVFLNGQ